MVLESISSFIYFIVYIFTFFIVFLYVKNIIANRGFNCLSMFILTFTMFYLVVPFFQTFFKLHRNEISPYCRLLNQLSEGEIFLNFLVSLVCLSFVILSYNLKLKNVSYDTSFKSITNDDVDNEILLNKISRISDVIFFVSTLSIILLIIEVGSINTYMTLGVLTRGLDKTPTELIRPSYLQLVTLSALILVPPYLYLYLYRVKKNKVYLVKFVVSLVFSMLYLLYNQGRAPLVLFFLPFIITTRKRDKKKLFSLIVLFIFSLFLLKYLDAIFKYLAYGYFTVEKNTNYITKFLGEFSYPFANFSLKSELIDYFGYRYMYDYIIWPLTMIPSSLLNLIGLSKKSIVSVSSLNTEAYGFLLGIRLTGGIPVDFLTVQYYQFGYPTLIISCLVVGRLLRALDKIFFIFKNDYSIKIILLRLSFSIINILNNADISAIVRNRLDVVLLLIILIYIYRQTLRHRKFAENNMEISTT